MEIEDKKKKKGNRVIAIGNMRTSEGKESQEISEVNHEILGGKRLNRMKIRKIPIISGLSLEQLFLVDVGSVRLWVVKALDKMRRSIDGILKFLYRRNRREPDHYEYALLVDHRGDRTLFKYLNTAQNSVPFDQIYGKLFPTVEELEKRFTDPRQFTVWLEQLSLR